MSTLPERLREATRGLHERAEGLGFMAALAQGRQPCSAYRALLAELLPLYEALETALRAQSGAPWLAGLDLAALARAPALRADLADHTVSPTAPPTARAATEAYVVRLQALGAAQDPALLAHVYTRYLGDLHGGQVLRRMVMRCYPAQGTAFLDFGEGAAGLRRQLVTALTEAPLDAAASDRVVAEACWSFEQHHRLFEELAAATPGP